jgi:hypothetical protein
MRYPTKIRAAMTQYKKSCPNSFFTFSLFQGQSRLKFLAYYQISPLRLAWKPPLIRDLLRTSGSTSSTSRAKIFNALGFEKEGCLVEAVSARGSLSQIRKRSKSFTQISQARGRFSAPIVYAGRTMRHHLDPMLL